MPLTWSELEVLTFFAVLVRYGTLVALLPLTGDRIIPAPIKILLALCFTVVLYPILVSTGQVDPRQAAVWGASAFGIAKVVAIETVFGLAVGFAARFVFEVVNMGGDLAGNFMGFAAASQYDPHQETQTQVVSRILGALAMLIFLAVDGHHLVLHAALSSYQVVPMGKLEIGAAYSQKLIALTGETFRIGVQLAAPMALSFFGINVVYGIMAKAMPQLNILVLSFSVSAFIGMFLLYASLPEFSDVMRGIFGTMDRELYAVMTALRGN